MTSYTGAYTGTIEAYCPSFDYVFPITVMIDSKGDIYTTASFYGGENEGLDTDENIYMSGTTAGLTKSASGTVSSSGAISNLAYGINSESQGLLDMAFTKLTLNGSSLKSVATSGDITLTLSLTKDSAAPTTVSAQDLISYYQAHNLAPYTAVQDMAANIVADMTTLQNIASLGLLTSVTVSDSPADIVADLSQLESLPASLVNSIIVSQDSNATLDQLQSIVTGLGSRADLSAIASQGIKTTVTAAEIANDQAALAALGNSVTLRFAETSSDYGVMGVYSNGKVAIDDNAYDVTHTTDSLQALSAKGLLASVTATDGVGSLATDLDGLEGLFAQGLLTSVTATPAYAGDTSVRLTPTQMANDAGVLKEISGSFDITLFNTTNGSYDGSNAAGHAVTVDFTNGDLSNYSFAAAGDGHSLTVTYHYSANSTSNYTVRNVTALDIETSNGGTLTHNLVIVAASPGPASAVTTGNITELYAAVFSREPDVDGLAFYQNFLASNPTTPLQTFADYFLNSAEYKNNTAHNYAVSSAGDTQFIEDSYQNLLHRTPSSDEVNFYLTNVMEKAEAGLTAGTTAFANAQFQAHAQMLVYFSASAEFLNDVQITASNPASAQHWLLLT